MPIVHGLFLFKSTKLKIITDKRRGKNKELKALPKMMAKKKKRPQGAALVGGPTRKVLARKLRGDGNIAPA